MMYGCVVWVSLLLLAFVDAASDSKDELRVTSWTQWLTYCISKGVYIVLIGLITLCVAVNHFKIKYGESGWNLDGKLTWMDTLWKATGGSASSKWVGCLTPSPSPSIRKLLCNGDDIDNCIPEGVKKELIEAKTALALLKSELEEAKSSRIELETVIAELKARSDESDPHGSEYKKLYEETQKQLKKVSTERDKLVVEKDMFERDARIKSAAMHDLHLSEVRLEEANIEINNLKRQNNHLKQEKEIITKIFHKIKDASRSPLTSDYMKPEGSPADYSLEDSYYEADLLANLAEDVGMPCDSSMEYILNSNEISSLVENLTSFDDGQEARPVTQSVFFRQFCEKNFSALSMNGLE